MKKNIEPVTFFPQQATQLCVDDCHVRLGESANVQYSFLDNSGNQLRVSRMEISGDDYQQWNDNDDYIFDFVANKLGVTVLPDNPE